jgi:hypothetical protein
MITRVDLWDRIPALIGAREFPRSKCEGDSLSTYAAAAIVWVDRPLSSSPNGALLEQPC